MAAQNQGKGVALCKVVGVVADKTTEEPEPMATVCAEPRGQKGKGVRKVLSDSVGRFEIHLPVHPGGYTLSAAVLGRKAVPLQITLSEEDTLRDVGRLYVVDDVKMLK